MAAPSPDTKATARRLAGKLLIAAVFGIAAGLTLYVALRYSFMTELLRAFGYGNF